MWCSAVVAHPPQGLCGGVVQSGVVFYSPWLRRLFELLLLFWSFSSDLSQQHGVSDPPLTGYF